MSKKVLLVIERGDVGAGKDVALLPCPAGHEHAEALRVPMEAILRDVEGGEAVEADLISVKDDVAVVNVPAGWKPQATGNKKADADANAGKGQFSVRAENVRELPAKAAATAAEAPAKAKAKAKGAGGTA